MRRFVPLFLALALLGGCGGFTTRGQLTEAELAAMTPEHHVYAARLDYNRLLLTVDRYANQPACSDTIIVGCSETVVVRAALTWLTEADNALDAAEVIVRGGGATPDGLLSTSRGALAKLSTYLVAKEIVR